MKVIQSLKSRLVRLPVLSSVDLVAGTLLIKGTSGGTNLGTAIVGAATSAAGTYVGILAELHDYSVNGSALVAGAQHSDVITGAAGAAWFAPMGGNPAIFPSRQVEVLEGLTLCKIDYSLGGSVSASSSTTTVTIGSLEDNIDTGFLYSYGGTGAAKGELRFIDTSAVGSCTTSVAFTTMASDYVVKVLPLLHGLVVLTVGNTTTPTKINTTAAVGACRFVQLERHIVRNGLDEMMDPYTHRNLSGLDDLNQFGMYGVFAVSSSVFQPLA